MSFQCCCMLHVAASNFSDTATESSDVRQSNMQMLCNNMHDMQQGCDDGSDDYNKKLQMKLYKKVMVKWHCKVHNHQLGSSCTSPGHCLAQELQGCLLGQVLASSLLQQAFFWGLVPLGQSQSQGPPAAYTLQV